jgi:hypothetical protein
VRKRDFKRGGWEVATIGLLHQLSRNARYETSCEEILTMLAPVDMEPTNETARQQYACLDVNLRVRVLQILCLLTVGTQKIRDYMEECSAQMTTFRKEKIEWQRIRKVA